MTKILSLVFSAFILSAVLCSCATNSGKDAGRNIRDMKDNVESRVEGAMPSNPSSPARDRGANYPNDGTNGILPDTDIMDGILNSDFPGLEGTNIRTLFDTSFVNARWYKPGNNTDAHKGSDKNSYIVFEGDNARDGMSSHVKITFTLDESGDLDIHECTVDGVKVSKAKLMELLVKDDKTPVTK